MVRCSLKPCSSSSVVVLMKRPHPSLSDAPESSEPLLLQRIRHQGLVAATREVAPQLACFGMVFDGVWMVSYGFQCFPVVTVPPFGEHQYQVLSPWQKVLNLTLRSVTEKLLVLLKEVNMGLRQHKPWAGIGQEIAHRLTTYSHFWLTFRSSYLEWFEMATCIWRWLCKQLNVTISCGIKLPYQSPERNHERLDLLYTIYKINITGVKTNHSINRHSPLPALLTLPSISLMSWASLGLSAWRK